MTTVENKEHRKFVVFLDKEGGVIYVGATALLGNIAAQLIVHETMKASNLKPSGTWMNLETDGGDFVLGVGYKLGFYNKLFGRGQQVMLDVIDIIRDSNAKAS